MDSTIPMFADSFSPAYRISERTGSFRGRRFKFGGGAEGVNTYSILVTSDQQEWLGEFPIECAPPAVTGAFASPLSDKCIVIAGGRGYHVDVSFPDSYEVLPVFPNMSVHVLRRSLVLLDHTTVCLLGKRTAVSSRLSDDGLEFEESGSDYAVIRGWNSAEQKAVRWLLRIAEDSHECSRLE